MSPAQDAFSIQISPPPLDVHHKKIRVVQSHGEACRNLILLKKTPLVQNNSLKHRQISKTTKKKYHVSG